MLLLDIMMSNHSHCRCESKPNPQNPGSNRRAGESQHNPPSVSRTARRVR
jgi:hypothetical protein